MGEELSKSGVEMHCDDRAYSILINKEIKIKNSG